MTANIFDIAIIGGGVIGLALARALGEERARVAVIDAGGEIPTATNAAAGMLAPSFETAAESAALYDFGAASLAVWPAFAAALEEETGRSIDFRRDGTLGVAFDETAAEKLRAEHVRLKTRDAQVDFLSGDDARRLEPALSERIVAALYAKKDVQVDARKLLAALRSAVKKNGGSLFSERVEKVERKNGRFALRLAQGGPVAAETAVLASGAAAGALIADLPPPPVYPVKGEAVALRLPDAALRRVVRGPGAYLCPKTDGRLIIGATEYEGRADCDVDPDAIARLVREGARAVPFAARCPELERWAGLRPATPDKAPILGCDARGPDNVFLALGHHRNGVLLAPASAAALCDAILGRTPLTPLKAFRPERFDMAHDA